MFAIFARNDIPAHDPNAPAYKVLHAACECNRCGEKFVFDITQANLTRATCGVHPRLVDGQHPNGISALVGGVCLDCKEKAEKK